MNLSQISLHLVGGEHIPGHQPPGPPDQQQAQPPGGLGCRCLLETLQVRKKYVLNIVMSNMVIEDKSYTNVLLECALALFS